MAGEDQYINPIIRAMMASSQLAQNSQKLKQEGEQQKAEREARERQLDLEQTRIDNEHDYQHSLIDNATQLLKAHLSQNYNEGIKTLQEARNSGVDIAKAFPGQSTDNLPNTGNVDLPPELQPKRTVSIPGLGINNIPEEAFSSPEQLLKLKMQGIAGETTAKEAAQAPFIEAQRQRDFNRENQLNQQNHTFQSQQLIQQGANAQRIANINGHYRIQAEHEATAGRLEVARVTHGLGLDDQNSLIASNAFDSLINGTSTWESQTPNNKRAIESIAATKGWVIPKTKDYASALEGAASAQELVQQARDLANKFSSDSNGGRGGIIGGTYNAVKSKIPTTEISTAMDSLNGKVNIASKALGINRTSNAEMDRLFKSVFNPARTRAENLENVEKLSQTLNTQVKAKFPANVPSAQVNYVLGNRGITEFGGFNDPAKRPVVIHLDDGTDIPDTPQNRQLHNMPLTAKPEDYK